MMISVRLTVDELLEVDAYLVRQLRGQRDEAKRNELRARIESLRSAVRRAAPTRESNENANLLHAYTHDAAGRLVPVASTRNGGGVSIDLACVMAGLAISLAFWGLLSAWLVPGTVIGDQSSVIGEAAVMDRLKAEIESLTEQVAVRERNCDDLVNALNSAIAERNEAVALLRSLMSIDEGPPEADAAGGGVERRETRGEKRL